MPAATAGFKTSTDMYYFLSSSAVSLSFSQHFGWSVLFVCLMEWASPSSLRCLSLGSLCPCELWLERMPVTGVTWHDRAVSVPAYILLGLPCWLGLDCLFSGECLRLPHLLTPLAVCVPREGRSRHGPTVQAVAAALCSLVPKFSLNRLTGALAHIASHSMAPGIWLCQRQSELFVYFI